MIIIITLTFAEWPFLYLQNGGNSPQKKPLAKSLIFILKFQKHWIWFIVFSKIELKFLQINLTLELFMCLK
jgi:hypothetical protein